MGGFKFPFQDKAVKFTRVNASTSEPLRLGGCFRRQAAKHREGLRRGFPWAASLEGLPRPHAAHPKHVNCSPYVVKAEAHAVMRKAVPVPARGEKPSQPWCYKASMAVKASDEPELLLQALTGRSSNQHTERRHGGTHAALHLLPCQFSHTLKLTTTSTATGTVHSILPVSVAVLVTVPEYSGAQAQDNSVQLLPSAEAIWKK